MDWQPHITVATIIEDQGRFLLVEELKGEGGRAVLNQPAGHLDPNETLGQAAVRETLEETGWDVELTGVVGLYLYTAPSNGVTYQRVCFTARTLRYHPIANSIPASLAPSGSAVTSCSRNLNAGAASWYCAASTTTSQGLCIPWT